MLGSPSLHNTTAAVGFVWQSTDSTELPLTQLNDQPIVVTEQVDGVKVSIRFTAAGELHLDTQAYGPILNPAAGSFKLLVAWVNRHRAALWNVLGDRFRLDGVWCYEQQFIFYDHLPHYFLAEEILDQATQQWLSSMQQDSLLASLPVVSAPVLFQGLLSRPEQFSAWMGASTGKSSSWWSTLIELALSLGLDPVPCLGATDPSPLMQGLSLRVETPERVVGRYQWLRAGLWSAIAPESRRAFPSSQTPFIPNQLRPGIDIFAEQSPPDCEPRL